MPRPVDLTGTPAPSGNDGSADRAGITAARLVAVAITSLLISFLVIDRTSAAFAANATTPPAELATGSVSLADDDEGRTMFDLDTLLPGRTVTNCINVSYTGTAFDGSVGLFAGGGGEIAPYLDVEILAGTGGGFGDCDGFVRQEQIYVGTLADLVAEHGRGEPPLEAIQIDSATVARTFRVAFTLRDDPAVAGLTGSVDFGWTVSF